MSSYEVSSGKVSSGIILYTYNDAMFISMGGTATNTTVNGGLLHVSSGGMANNTMIKYGSMYVASKGVANSTAVNGGLLHVSSGGIANITTVSSGLLYISSGGTANSITVNHGGLLYVSSGGTAANIIWTPFVGNVDMEDGAYVTYAGDCSGVYFGNKNQLLSSAVLMEGKTVYGSMYILSGGTATGTTVNDGNTWNSGRMYIASDGTANNTMVNGFGKMYIFRGGTANSTTVNANGRLYVSDGGKVENTTLNNWGGLVVSNGGIANNIMINTSGHLWVSCGGTANSATVNSYGWLKVSSGGTANNTMINYCGSIYLFNGGTANDTIINSGGVQIVSSGGTATNTTVNSGIMTISNGTVTNTTINFGIMTISGGTADNTTVNSGTLQVSCCGTATNTTINEFGKIYVASGGTANNIAVNCDGWLSVFSGGTATNTTINSGGQYIINDGGMTTDTVVNFDGNVNVSSGGTANRTIINSGGVYIIVDGGTANETTINEFGTMAVFNGGTALNVVENGGYVGVYEGAYITFMPNSFSGLVLDNANATVHSGTTATGTMVNFGGCMSVFSGGTATDTTVNSGIVTMSGGTATNTTVNSGIMTIIDGTATNTTVNSGIMTICNGTATNTTVNSGALQVFSGGTAINTTVNSDGIHIVSSGGIARGIIVNSGGLYIIVDGGMTTGTAINSNGNVNVSSGGIARGTIVNSGGLYIIVDGGTVNDATINEFGKMYVLSGGKVTGILGIASGANVSAYEGSIFDFDISGLSGSNAVLVNNLALVKGTPNFTITVSATQANGTYTLAGGASAFTGSLSIGTMETNYGTITVNGDALKHGSQTFTLSTSGESLQLTVEDGTMLPEMLSVAADITAATNQDVTVSATFSGNATFRQYSLDNSTWQVYTNGVVMPVNGTVYFRAGNAAGYSDVVYYTVTNIDKVAPVITLVGDTQSAVYETSLTATVDDGSKLYYRIGDSAWLEYTAPITVSANAIYSFKATDTAGNIGTTSIKFSNILSKAPTNLVGSKDALSWGTTGASRYVVEYSTDNFEHSIKLTTTQTGLDSLDLPAGTYQWRVRSEDNDQWTQGESIISDNTSTVPKVISSTANGNGDVFFATANGTWTSGYAAKHVGSVGDWDGTNELVSTTGKNRLYNLFFGSTDSNILLLTDDANGDAIFVDDIYTELPGTVSQQQSRIARIQEIRAGVGDDIVDMTSQRFEYISDGLTIRGGAGNDTLWANKGNNMLFGDAGNDRLIGASGNDVLAGGIGNDRMHGGGGSDIFAFCDNWGADTVEQLADGDVTLWFESGSLDNWDASTLTYTDGTSSVKVSGVTADKVSLKFGDDGSEQYASLTAQGAFADFSSEKIFEDKNKGVLATL